MKLLTPIISEKTTAAASENQYVFRASKKIGKKEAKNIIEKNFKVNVINIRSLNCQSKKRRRGLRLGATASYKKIIVRLKKGQTIDVFEVET